jgi:hypothetical protein
MMEVQIPTAEIVMDTTWHSFRDVCNGPIIKYDINDDSILHLSVLEKIGNISTNCLSHLLKKTN